MIERKKAVEWFRRMVETVHQGLLVQHAGGSLPYPYRQIFGAKDYPRNITNTRKTTETSPHAAVKHAFDDCLLVGIYIVQDGEVVYANEKLAKILGYPKDQLIGMSPGKLFQLDHRRSQKAAVVYQQKPAAIPPVHEARGIRKNGKVIWIRRSEILIAHRGSPAILGNVIDLTPKKRLKDVVWQSKHELRLLSAKLLGAQEQERKRIASELHDTVGQYLSAIKFSLDNVNALLEDNQIASGQRSLRAVIPVIQEAISEVRRISMDLRPAILDDLGLLATLSWHCRTFQDIYACITVEKQIELQESDVPGGLKTAIYRIIQEALNNVAKHAKADRIVLRLRKIDTAVELIVTDDGWGFDVSETVERELRQRGLGLASMRQRCEGSGGAFYIDSAPGIGTIVRAVWAE
ncbi:MAG: PAS domain-containing sensor histidine kinase [Methylocaldum sp.]|uniref:PAS domain-containing sensor histidine kinase n=1 Tax=Methylocaldum sp. 14B TaxID=1912213 RepID=UPI00143B4ACD|nr:PAS domain-containing sensor histidine kinase [Methylocaldum sp. 14B]MDV3240946.1 PAS domain-containing sensor histidine kinase [Methylocaldum sp.]